MNKIVKNKWIKALLSGDYRQGLGRLRNTELDGDDSHCCLGVLCNIVASQHWRKQGHEWSINYGRLDRKGSVPDTLASKLGLARHDQNYLINLNDDKKYTFKQIAAYIKRYL